MLCSADFQTALGVRPCVKSAHFALHHVPLAALAQRTPRGDLSTAAAPNGGVAVDESVDISVLTVPVPTSVRIDLGLVVPKRHARRAVTRNLVKRHIRATFGEQLRATGLGAGGWVVRLRSPIEVARFSSAKSPALASVVRAELTELMRRAGALSSGSVTP